MSALGGVSAPGGVSDTGGLSALGSVCSRGRGVCSGRVSAPGGVSQHALRQNPPLLTESQMPVKTLPCPNFVTGGKDWIHNRGFMPIFCVCVCVCVTIGTMRSLTQA